MHFKSLKIKLAADQLLSFPWVRKFRLIATLKVELTFCLLFSDFAATNCPRFLEMIAPTLASAGTYYLWPGLQDVGTSGIELLL